MDCLQFKGMELKFKNASSTDNNKVNTKIRESIRTSMESKIASEINMKAEVDIDVESAYEESFCSNESDSEEESILSNVSHKSSTSRIPLFRFSSSRTLQKKKEPIKKSASTSKINDDASELEDKIKCLNLRDVRPIKSAQIRPSRKNMSFSNDQVMKIERDNEILLRKIMSQQKTRKTKLPPVQQKLSSSAINRKKLQQKIETDNMMLLRRLQQTKSCTLNTNKISGFRTIHL